MSFKMSFASTIYFTPFLSALLLCLYNTFIHVVTYNTYLIGEKPADEFVEDIFLCVFSL